MSARDGVRATGSVRDALVAAARAELLEHGAGGIGLRAVARRAGVSHAAPKHHFGDHAGLLTAVAVEGFSELADALRRAEARGPSPASPPDPTSDLIRFGRAYLEFGLAHPELFELMFRSDQLDRADPALTAAQHASFSLLTQAVAHAGGAPGPPSGGPEALVSWAFIHGLVVLVRDGALQAIGAATTSADAATLADHLVETFTELLRARSGR